MSNLNPNDPNPYMYIRNGRQVWLTNREVMIARGLIIIPEDNDITTTAERENSVQPQVTQSQRSIYQPFRRTMPKRVYCEVCRHMMRPGHHH
jgi:hypothetical protein